MSGLREITISIVRIALGVIIFLGVLIVVDFIVYLGVHGTTFSEQIATAYNDGYKKAYASSFSTGYQDAYSQAYQKGYSKGYQIGLSIGPKEETSNRVELIKPAFTELKEFLAQDETNLNPFIPGEYVCFHYAADLNNNAEANGIRAAYVRIHTKNWAHALVAFETADRGLIFIEPQSDRKVTLTTGKPYPWHQAGAYPLTGDLNDPIVEIQIIW